MMQLTSAIKNECSSNMSSYLWVTLIYISQKYYSVLTKMLILQNSVYTGKCQSGHFESYCIFHHFS